MVSENCIEAPFKVVRSVVSLKIFLRHSIDWLIAETKVVLTAQAPKTRRCNTFLCDVFSAIQD